MLDRHHQLTNSFLHDHYSVIAINAIFLTILETVVYIYCAYWVALYNFCRPIYIRKEKIKIKMK